MTTAHSELEGISNCTKCHDLGKQVSKAKCLECHTEITDLINENRGYHSQHEVVTKDCWTCHGEHYGRNFQIVRFNENEFDHSKSGFELKGSHENLKCDECHAQERIKIEKLKSRSGTFLGLQNECSSCHTDIHQGTLSTKCENCHNEDKFKNPTKFSHSNARFKLTGKHETVECKNCHPLETRNSKSFRVFRGIKFNSCNNCHLDIHEGKLGKNCESCHNTITFRNAQKLDRFNHSRTNFPLIGKHNLLKCQDCHKGSLTAEIKHSQCYDCHKDYHNGEFNNAGSKIDCDKCHNENGFSPSVYTIEQHSKTNFILTFSHKATPCSSCHLLGDRWQFSINHERCIDCHKNIHNDYISESYFDENKCESCHTVVSWRNINFEHDKTNFDLEGRHKSVGCGECHFDRKTGKTLIQKFKSLNSLCTGCHSDVHQKQFTVNDMERCTDCHTFSDWNPTLFKHSETKFVLDGAHQNIKCIKCHSVKIIGDVQFINYKIEDFSCKSCHS